MPKTIKSYWIKKRYNPQFDKPYFVACGQLSKREAKKKEKSLYGWNEMLEFPILESYEKKIKELKDKGEIIHGHSDILSHM